MNADVFARASAPFTRWQRSLAIRPRDLANEEAALAHARGQTALMCALDGGSAALAAYLRQRVELDAAAAIGAPQFPRQALTHREFREMPAELEIALGDAWAEAITPAQASRPLFWLLCHIEWLEQERFGVDRMHEYFTAGGGRGDALDARTRTFLRRSGGLPHVRGNVSALSDCPLARAWWRVRIATEAASAPDAGLSRGDAHTVLRASGPVWERFVMLALQRITAISQPRARAALIAALAHHGEPDAATVQRIAQALARMGSMRSLQHVPWAELRDIAHAQTEGATAL